MFLFQLVQQPANGMIDYFETKSQPITMAMVLKAYGIVRANKGGGGVDGMTWAELDANQRGYLYRLWNRLSSGIYFPSPVLEVEIPKKRVGVRPLGIPTPFGSHCPTSGARPFGKAIGAVVS
jgi:RNA-directed DNA polymerase